MYKLNLGCGRKLMSFKDGWINTDIIDPPASINNLISTSKLTPEFIEDVKDVCGILYIQNDSTTLEGIPDNFFDEIHAYHIVEHIIPSEIPSFLKLLRSKLKEGGVLVVELPDIVKCCINFLQSLTTKDNRLSHHLGIKGIFGETHKNSTVYDFHKWGWTYETLRIELIKAGFSAIEERTPETHAGPVRDFSAKATK
jgi:predicted SAM-dependent methyltransferase